MQLHRGGSMNRTQYLVILICVFAGGIIGGALSERFLQAGVSAFAKQSASRRLETIGAEKFVVTDVEGNVRAVFGMIKEEPVLMMFGRDRRQPRLMVFDDRCCRIELSLGPDGDPSLNLFDGNSILRTAVGAVRVTQPKTGKTKHMPSMMAVFDEKGTLKWNAPRFMSGP